MTSPTRHVLIVASRTATSDELRSALLARRRRGPTEFTLLLPAPRDAGEAGAVLRHAVERLRAEGLDVAGMLGEADPCAAVAEVWDPHEHDEIVLATLAPGASHWLASAVPAGLERLTGVPVAHVVASATVGVWGSSSPSPTTPSSASASASPRAPEGSTPDPR